MKKKNSRNTKKRIEDAAWKLFEEQGYDNTTVEEIIFESETSKGSFYHYFSSKDDLLKSVSEFIDNKYEELSEIIDYNQNSVDLLSYLNQEIVTLLENTFSIELLTRLFSSQLSATAEKFLFNPDRTYYRLVFKI